MNASMTESQAITCAAEVMRNHPMANALDFTRATATYMDGAKATERLRIKWPNIKLRFSSEDFWLVSFPLLEADVDQRISLTAKVDPITGSAEIMLDL
jgi:hypothetical protein